VEFGYYQVQWYSGGSVTANVLNGGYAGVSVYSPVTVSGNTVDNQTIGIQACCGVTATSNKISNVTNGINDFGGGDTYKSNTITWTGIGIEFNCNTPTALGNTINDVTTGLDNVPSAFTGANSFNNVVTLRSDGCAFRPTPAAPHSGPILAPTH
jgi:hypothetical protein